MKPSLHIYPEFSLVRLRQSAGPRDYSVTRGASVASRSWASTAFLLARVPSRQDGSSHYSAIQAQRPEQAGSQGRLHKLVRRRQQRRPLGPISPVELRPQQSDPNRKWGYTTTVVPGYAVVESLKDFRVPILKLGVERPRLKQKTLNPTWGIEAPSVPARRV